MRAIEMSRYGGPEVLETVQLPAPVPTSDQVLIEVEAAGVNYADTHQTENSYLAPTPLPFVPGIEAVGRTPDGRRVLALVGRGGYAEVAVAPTAAVVDLPEAIDDGAALALAVQGLTAYHALRTSARLEPGGSVVVHAGAGGVGSLAVQLAKLFGSGRIIASASTPEKRQLALDLGADVAIDSAADDLAGEIRGANDGHGVDVVLEMSGGLTFAANLEALAPFGRLVTYGAASRQPAHAVEPAELLRGSRAIVGFLATDCFTRPGMYAQTIGELLVMVIEGVLSPVVGGRYPLGRAQAAHEDLRARRTTGKLVLDPRLQP
jgi:NADPH:quinone reductase